MRVRSISRTTATPRGDRGSFGKARSFTSNRSCLRTRAGKCRKPSTRLIPSPRITTRSPLTRKHSSVTEECFRVSGLRVVMRGEGINRVDGLRHFPARVRRHDRLLVKLRAFPNEPRSPRGVAVVREIDLTRIAGGDQGWALIHGPVALKRIDRGPVARFAIKLPVAVHIFLEMAVRALHSVREVDVFEVNRLGEFIRIVVWNLVVAQIEQIAFAIVLEDRAENPAVAVVIGKLGVLQLRI